MRILVTGASGFIGSALTQRLVEENHEVGGLFRYVADGRYDYYQLDSKLVCDVRDRARLVNLVKEFKPEVVFNLAAMTPVSYSFLSPVEVTEVDYIGTMNVAEACLKAGVNRLIHASTSEFYGSQKSFPIEETATPNPMSPYAVAKIAAEEYLKFLGRTESLPYVVMRPYNTYNRSQVNKRYFVVERAITGAILERRIKLYDPAPVRDLLDRDSHVDAYVKALHADDSVLGEAFNVGLGLGCTIEEMANKVKDLVEDYLGDGVSISWEAGADRPHDIQKLVCDNRKARELLSWQPLYSLEEGLSIAVTQWIEVLERRGEL